MCSNDPVYYDCPSLEGEPWCLDQLGVCPSFNKTPDHLAMPRGSHLCQEWPCCVVRPLVATRQLFATMHWLTLRQPAERYRNWANPRAWQQSFQQL